MMDINSGSYFSVRIKRVNTMAITFWSKLCGPDICLPEIASRSKQTRQCIQTTLVRPFYHPLLLAYIFSVGREIKSPTIISFYIHEYGMCVRGVWRQLFFALHTVIKKKKRLLKTDIELIVLLSFNVRNNTHSLRLVQQQTSVLRLITFICSNVILLGLCGKYMNLFPRSRRWGEKKNDGARARSSIIYSKIKK